jgi:hypothetical protein
MAGSVLIRPFYAVARGAADPIAEGGEAERECRTARGSFWTRAKI